MHNFVVREDYEQLPVSTWTREELLGWLMDYGAFSCGMADGCLDEELIEEVLIQAGEIGDSLKR